MAFGRKKKDSETVNSNGVVANGKEAKTLIDSNGTAPAQNGRVHKDSVRSNQSLDFDPPDGGWGWVVCLASFWTNGTIFGILNIFGILYVKMLEEYDNGDPNLRFKTSWIGALQIFLTFFLSPVASILVDRIGIRPTGFLGAFLATLGMFCSSFVGQIEIMYLTYGVLLGLGSSIIYNPSLVILGHYFKHKLGIVNGLVAFGSGVFTIILPFVMQWSLREIGLSWSMRLLSAMLALLMIGSLTWIPKFQARHTELDHYLHQENLSICTRMSLWMKKFLNVRIWKNKGYLVWAVASPVAFLGYFVPFVHLVKHTNDRMPSANAATLVMCIGITSAVSRLIFGKVADLPRVNRIRMQQCAFLVLGIVTSCIPLAKDFWPLIIITLIMGMADGCFICLIGPIAFDLLGPQGAAQGIGCMLGIASIPMTAGPPLAGLMYDYLGSYDIAFYCGGIPPLLASVLLFLIPRQENKGQGQPSVSMTKSMVAMSMENLDRIGEADDDLSAHIKPQFQHLMDDSYIRSARSWSMLNQQVTGSVDLHVNSRKAVSLSHLGPRRHSGGSKTHFIAKPSPLAMEDKTQLRKSSEPISGSSFA